MSTPEKDAVVAEEPKAVEANGEAETNEKDATTNASPPEANTNSTASANGTPKKSPTSTPGFHHHVVMTDKSGALNVYVQGDIEDAHKDKDSKTVFLTCHDIGNNHSSFSVRTMI